MPHFIKLFFIFFFFSSYTIADELIIEPDAGRAPLLNAIKNTKSSIDIVMYGFTDKTLMQALIQAKNHGKNITLLLEPNPYQSDHENDRVIRTFTKNQIPLKWPAKTFQLTHQKTFIFDHATAIVMTFNLTHSSFSRERNFALIITDPNEVQEINRVFAADVLHHPVTVNDPHLLWSPDNSREKMLRFIQSAQSEINIYAQDLSDYQIIGALAKAARRGIKIKILLSVSPEKYHSNKFSFLEKAGVVIQNSQHYYIHAKVMIEDHKRALLGSINFTQPSLNDNRELSVITEDRNVINSLDRTFASDWNGVVA